MRTFVGYGATSGIEKLFRQETVRQLKDRGVIIGNVVRLLKYSYSALTEKFSGSSKLILMETDEFDKSLAAWSLNDAMQYIIAEWERGGASQTKIEANADGYSFRNCLFSAKKYEHEGKEYKSIEGIGGRRTIYNRVIRTSSPNDKVKVSLRRGYFNVILSSDEKIIGYAYGLHIVWRGTDMCLATYEFLSNVFFSVDPTISASGVKNFKIGADLEFVPVDSDGIIHEATEFVHDNKDDAAIGTDGYVKLLEIRPDPGNTYLELVDNVSSLLGSLNEIMPKGYDLASGGGRDIGHSIGTHLHFSGLPTDYGQNVDPSVLVDIFDEMIYKPIQIYTRGWQRANAEYGQYGDYRSKGRPGHDGYFPHAGFEWRSLPSVCGNRELFKSITAISEGIARTWASGVTIEFEYTGRVSDYKNLVNYERILEEIAYFVNFLKSNGELAIPVLKGWFGRTGPKVEGEELRIYASQITGEAAPMIMNHERRIADKCVVAPVEVNHVLLSHNKLSKYKLQSLTKRMSAFVTSDLGRELKVIGWDDAFSYTGDGLGETKKNSRFLYIGIPMAIFKKLPKNNGSRNSAKMFIQTLIRNI